MKTYNKFVNESKNITKYKSQNRNEIYVDVAKIYDSIIIETNGQYNISTTMDEKDATKIIDKEFGNFLKRVKKKVERKIK